MCILVLSETLMHGFHYNYAEKNIVIKPSYRLQTQAL